MRDASRPLVVGIAGQTCAGKSTFATALQTALGGPDRCSIVHQDDYFSDFSEFPESERATVMSHNHPRSVRWELLRADIDALRSGLAIELPAPGTRAAASGERRSLVSARILIVEGHLIFADDATRDRLDVKLYIDVDPVERVLRRIERTATRGGDVGAAIEWFRHDVLPNVEFAARGRDHADLIIPFATENSPAVRFIAAGIEQLAGTRG